MARGCAPQRESPCQSFCLESFYFSLAGGNLGIGLRQGVSRICVRFPAVLFRVLVSPDWWVPGQGSLVNATRPEAEIQRRPRCCL